MNERSAAILEAAIRQYVETGEPVSSQQLAKSRAFGVRSATIRNELNALTAEGFLSQAHTSGGRVPTDKGYTFLVQKLLHEREAFSAPATRRQQSEVGALTSNLAGGRFETFVKDLVDDCNLLGVGYGPSGETVYKRGLDELFDQIASFGDVESLGELAEIAADFEAIDDRIGLLSAQLRSDEPTVFIGRSPITESRHLSVVADCFDCGGQSFVAAVIGPKRMHYGEIIGLFSRVRRTLNPSAKGGSASGGKP